MLAPATANKTSLHLFPLFPSRQVLALVRPATDAATLLARAAAARDPDLLSVARVDLAAPGAADAVCAALQAAAAAGDDPSAPATTPTLAVINVVGVRDLAVPEAAIRRVLTAGTLALWAGCVASGRVARVVAVAGGIHREAGRGGAPNRAMVHNRAREDALDAAAAEARAAWAAAAAAAGAGGGGRPPPTPTPTPALTVVDPSVFFKDAASIFGMVARASPPSLTLIRGGWAVRCAPISGRDLAAALVEAAGAPVAPATAASPVTRFSVGGPQALTFGELADAAAAALTGVPGTACQRVTLPRWAAWAAWKAAAGVGAATGSKRALGLARFLSFLWVVCTDDSPDGLVGEVRVGADRVEDLFAALAAERRQGQEGRG